MSHDGLPRHPAKPGECEGAIRLKSEPFFIEPVCLIGFKPQVADEACRWNIEFADPASVGVLDVAAVEDSYQQRSAQGDGHPLSAILLLDPDEGNPQPGDDRAHLPEPQASQQSNKLPDTRTRG